MRGTAYEQMKKEMHNASMSVFLPPGFLLLATRGRLLTSPSRAELMGMAKGDFTSFLRVRSNSALLRSTTVSVGAVVVVAERSVAAVETSGEVVEMSVSVGVELLAGKGGLFEVLVLVEEEEEVVFETKSFCMSSTRVPEESFLAVSGSPSRFSSPVDSANVSICCSINSSSASAMLAA